MRRILLGDYVLPGEYARGPVYLAYQLVDLNNNPIIGYSGGVGIVGEVVQLIEPGAVIELQVSPLITPASKWKFRLIHQNVEFSSISLSLGNGNDLTIPELFALENYWGAMLPDPTTAPIGSVPIVDADNQWGLAIAMQKLIYDPANIAGNVFDLSNQVGSLDAGVFDG